MRLVLQLMLSTQSKHNTHGGCLAVNDQMTLILIDWSHPMLRTSVYDTAQDTRVLSRHNVAHKAPKKQKHRDWLKKWGTQRSKNDCKCNLIFNEAILKLYGIFYSKICFDCAILIIRVLKNCKATTKEVKGNGIPSYHKCFLYSCSIWNAFNCK